MIKAARRRGCQRLPDPLGRGGHVDVPDAEVGGSRSAGCRRRPVLVGHSLCGVVGLRLAHLHPGLLAGLVALDAAIAVAPEVAEFTPVLVGRLQGLGGAEYRSAVRERRKRPTAGSTGSGPARTSQ